MSTGASLVTRGLVAVEAFGSYSLVDGLSRYLSAYNGLFRQAISKEVPLHLARGDPKTADNITKAAYTALFFSLAIESVALVSLAIFLTDGLLRLAMLTGAFLNAVDGVAFTDQALLRSTRRFRLVSLAQFPISLVSAGVLLFGSWRFGSEGYFFGLAAASGLRFVIIRLLTRQSPLVYVTWRLPRRAVWQMMRTGLSISLVGLAGSALLTVDRWVIAGYLGSRDLGYYSLGSSMVLSLSLIPISVASVCFPLLTGLVAKRQMEQARLLTGKAQVAIILTLVLVFGSVGLLLRPLISTLLPDYEPALQVYFVVLVEGYLYGAGMLAGFVHLALGRYRTAAAIAASCAILSLALNLVLVRVGLVGVAIGTTIAMGAFAILLNWSADKLLGRHGLQVPTVIGLGLLAGFYACMLTIGTIWAAAYLAAVGGIGLWYLMRILGIDPRRLPASVRAYLFTKAGDQ
ncbi:MAG: lipopolysaccharide biosynthesis protein [Dehalococcoidia bacterium]|nr:lipopolysaccharide biosynthesis protein [Dehalococcoidia bacterium]